MQKTITFHALTLSKKVNGGRQDVDMWGAEGWSGEERSIDKGRQWGRGGGRGIQVEIWGERQGEGERQRTKRRAGKIHQVITDLLLFVKYLKHSSDFIRHNA